MEIAVELAKKGKILKALMLVKQYVEVNEERWDNTTGFCRELFRAIITMPMLNDESWSIFVPSVNYDEFMKIVESVYECIR